MKKHTKRVQKTRRVQKKTCEHFCRHDYSPEIEKQFRKLAKENLLPYNPTKKDREFRIAACQQNYCNPGCKGYRYFSKEEERKAKRSRKGSFLKGLKHRFLKTLKKRGAVSYCDRIASYNPYHK